MAESQARKRKRPSAKEARARMARAAGSPAPISRAEEASEKTPASASSPTRRGRGGGEDEASGVAPSGRLVRLSVDVPADQHRRLRVMAAESGATGMAVVRALLAEMEADEVLAGRVRTRLGTSDSEYYRNEKTR